MVTLSTTIPTRTYTELIKFNSFIDRFRYLSLKGHVSDPTFGSSRYINQTFYASSAWKEVRNYVIIRDNACDLGLYGYDIFTKVLIHHMNPIKPSDIRENNPKILDPEFLICVSHNTHNAIHYGDESLLPIVPPERHPGDTTPWL